VGAEASEDELRQCYEVYLEEGRQDFPGFPEMSFESFAAAMRGPRYEDAGPWRTWAAWDGERLLGFGLAVYPDRHMTHWSQVRARVAGIDRRRGVGAALLRAIVADVRSEGRTMLANDQVRLGGEGERWANSVGFANTLSIRWQMLHVAEVDPALWDVPVPAGFRLEQWADAAPVALVDEFAAARNAIDEAPNGDSAYRGPEWTVERVRQAEADLRDAGDDSRFVVAVHEETGAVAALTGMLLRPGRVDLCWQRDTAVVAEYRGLGLGRVVKAAMMRWLLAEFPDLGQVITSTAAENAHMIRINEQIGYTHYADFGRFEASVEHIGAALGMQGTNSIPGPRREQELEGA